MGIAEDLKSLQELHDKGTLTDGEYSAAKAATINKGTATAPVTKAGRKSRVGLLLIILFGVIAVIWYSQGTKQTTQLIASAVHAPIQLLNEVQNVPAHSWKAIAFTTAYTGSVAVNIHVVRGNPMDVFVMNPDQVNNLKANAIVATYTDFDAQKTEVYDRSARLQQGAYYLVLRDTTLGILSAKASDVSVTIQLNP